MHNRSIICAVDRKYTVKDIHRCIHAVMALTAVVLLLLVFAASSLLQVKADEEKYQYNNVDTGYAVLQSVYIIHLFIIPTSIRMVHLS